jgi:hypothetical protein
MELKPCKQEDCKYFSKWHGEFDVVPDGPRPPQSHVCRCLFCMKFTRKDLYEKKEGK